MQISMYRASVPVFARALRNLIVILKKAEAHATERKIDPTVLLNYRLAADMFALTRQVQIATDGAKAAGARLAGIAVPSFPDEEKTFDELQARLTKTMDFLSSLSKSQFDGAGDRGGCGRVAGGDSQWNAAAEIIRKLREDTAGR